MAAPSTPLIDPTKPGKYPVILSDALLGKPSRDVYTGVRYNYRPELSSAEAPEMARVRQSVKDATYNLGFEDNGSRYQFNGERSSNDGKYVLVFDPARQAFVLHRIDSMFHMNVTRTPTNSDVESLRKEHKPLVVSTFKKPPRPLPKKRNPAAILLQPNNSQRPGQPSKEKEKPKPVSLTLPSLEPPPTTKAPTPAASAPDKKSKSKRPKSPVDSEEEDDDDDDGGLLIEYPGGNPSSFKPSAAAFPPQISRRFSEFVRNAGREEEEEEEQRAVAHAAPATRRDTEMDMDEDNEDDDDDDAFKVAESFRVPSPRGEHQNRDSAPPQDPTAETAAGAFGDDFDDDLEAELEREFEKAAREAENDSESSVSEED